MYGQRIDSGGTVPNGSSAQVRVDSNRALINAIYDQNGAAVDWSIPAPVQGYAGGVPVAVNNGTAYETVAAGQTDQIMGATGAVGDYLAGVLIVPGTTSPGAVSIKDGNGSAISIFTGGASSVATLHPFYVPIGANSLAPTTPGWKVTTGANVTAVGFGTFT